MTMSRWVVTGVSGSERIEFLNEIAEGVRRRSKTVEVYDVGQLISEECEWLRIVTVDSRMLDMDPHLLREIRRSALKEVRISIAKNPHVDLHLIGIHATFRWNGRFIPGVSWDDIREIGPDGFLNVVDNVDEVVERNRANLKWGRAEAPGPLRTQEWMMEEEFATQVFADVAGKPMYVVARKHVLYSISELLLVRWRRLLRGARKTPSVIGTRWSLASANRMNEVDQASHDSAYGDHWAERTEFRVAVSGYY